MQDQLFDECSICLEELYSNLIILQCNHVFHDDCIQQLMDIENLNKFYCPLCRDTITILNPTYTTLEINDLEINKPKKKNRLLIFTIIFIIIILLLIIIIFNIIN